MEFDMHIILLHFFIFCIIWQASVSANGEGGGIGGDLQALLSFKAYVDDPSGALASWNLSSSSHFCNNWIGVNCNLPDHRVTGLELSVSQLTGTLSPFIGNLTFLQYLDLSFNSFNGIIPREISQLTHLRYLELSYNSLTGTIPAEIGSLPNLVMLDVSENHLNGTIPPSFGNMSAKLPNLMYLLLGENQLTGTIPAEIGSLSNLGILVFSNNHLSGTIPLSFRNLSALTDVGLGNNNLRGVFPQELGKLLNLRSLDLSLNQLTGAFPMMLHNITKLQDIRLDYNLFNGSIPSDFGLYLPNLFHFSVQNNQFTGHIPASITNASVLDTLNFGFNQFSGQVPMDFGHLSLLRDLRFSNNLIKDGLKFITSLTNCTKLTILDISSNNLHGMFPNTIANLFNLQTLTEFSIQNNQLTGPIPASITIASGLQFLDVSFNQFSGQASMDFGHLSLLGQLDFSNNLINDGLEFITSLTNCTKLQFLDISSNNLHGMLPKTIANLSNNLVTLRLDDNYIYGGIPDGLENLKSLGRLNISHNNLRGTIPRTIGKITSLQELFLGNNVFTGGIPSSIGNLSLLTTLIMRGNKFSGGIPASLGHCTKLLHLDLSNNMLTEAIPRTIFSLTSLVSLSFAYNDLTGLLPFEVGKMIMLTLFDVSYNNLSGHLPVEIGKIILLTLFDVSHNILSGELQPSLGTCISLETFNAQSNHFSGSIPPSLAQIKFIQLLDLSNNDLTGKIPAEFALFNSTQFLNLSFNNLEGRVPDQGLFRNSTAFSIAGNGNLCGGIKSLHLPQCPSQQKIKHGFSFVMVLPAIIVVAFMSIAYICYFNHTSISRSLSIREPMNSPLGERYPKLSYAQLLQATDRFSSDNLIGTGRFSRVYKGVLTQFEQCIAIKVLKLDQSGARRSFVAECEALKYIRHRNLVKIITACSGTDYQRNEFKALVYEFMSNGNLDSWLHPISTESTGLDLIQRLSISIDVASVLVYLHHGCEIPILHRDIKPSNILLDDDFCAHLGDFGSARSLLNPIDRTSGGRLHPTANEIVGTVGYIALEYAVGAPASTLVDVYSYGVLLLEMFTGKRPTDAMFKDNFSLHNYVKMAIPDQVMSIADPRLFADCENNPFRASGEAIRRNDCEIKKCLASVFRVGVVCSAQIPKERMEIADALVILETVRDTLSKLLN